MFITTQEINEQTLIAVEYELPFYRHSNDNYRCLDRSCKATAKIDFNNY